MNYEAWAWVPLIGFEKNDVDKGVKRYLDALGFAPEGLSLFMFSPDVALLHEDSEEEIVLPADYCSYYGSSVNEERGVQPWTNLDVRELVRNFHANGVKVFAGLMGVYMRDVHHKEWASLHPETLDRRRTDWDVSLSLIKRMKDGTYVQDYFAKKIVETLRYYDFDGFHAADYLSPPARPLWESDWSDDIIEQFVSFSGVSLPADVAAPSDEDDDAIFEHANFINMNPRPLDGTKEWGNQIARLKRADWIWNNLRREWIDFYVNRWANCWKVIASAVHSIDKKVFVNNSWTHDPVEAIYRYGIDYRKLEEAGVDAIVAETVSSGMAITGHYEQPWHFAYLTMFLMMGGYAPSKKRLFLHSTRDSTEQWDAIRHAPTHLERDICSLPNVYSVMADGKLKRCADGFLICLGDGMNHYEWEWLRERWNLGFDKQPKRILSPTLILFEHAINAEVDEIVLKKRCTSHQIITDMMFKGLGIGVSADISNLDSVKGPIILVNADYFSKSELDRVFAYEGGPIMLIGKEIDVAPVPDMSFKDVQEPDAISCMVYGFSGDMKFEPFKKEDEEIPADINSVEEPRSFYIDIYNRKVSSDFLSACVQTAIEISNQPFISGKFDGMTLQAMEFEDGIVRLLIKSNLSHYVDPVIDMQSPISKVTIISRFPAAKIEPNGSIFSVRVPPNGITVVDISF